MKKSKSFRSASDANLKKDKLLLTAIITTYLSLNNHILAFLKHNHLALQVLKILFFIPKGFLHSISIQTKLFRRLYRMRFNKG